MTTTKSASRRKRAPRASVRLREAMKNGLVGHVLPSDGPIPEEPRFGVGVSWPLPAEGICGSVVRTMDGWQGYPLTEPMSWTRLLAEVIPANQWRNIRQTDLLTGGEAMQRAFAAFSFGGRNHAWRIKIDPTMESYAPLLIRADQRCATASTALHPDSGMIGGLSDLTAEVRFDSTHTAWVRVTIRKNNSELEMIRSLDDMAEVCRILMMTAGLKGPAGGYEDCMWWVADSDMVLDVLDPRIIETVEHVFDKMKDEQRWDLVRRAMAGLFHDKDRPRDDRGQPLWHAGEPIPVDLGGGVEIHSVEQWRTAGGYRQWMLMCDNPRKRNDAPVFRLVSENASVEVMVDDVLDFVSVVGLISLQLEDASRTRRAEAAYL